MSLAPAVYLLGIGGIGGFFIGYGIRKIIKVLALTLGIFVFALMLLDYMNVFAINYDGVVEFVSKLFDPAQAVEVLTPLITNLPLVLSFTVGFALGLRKG